MTKVTFEDSHQKITIEVSTEEHTMGELLNDLIVPMLKAISYSNATIMEFIDVELL